MHGATGSWKQIAVRLGTVMRTSFKALSPGVARHTTGYAFEDVYSTKFKPTAAIGRKHQVVFCRPVCSVCLWAVVQNQLPSICELFRRCRPQSEERAWRATLWMRLWHAAQKGTQDGDKDIADNCKVNSIG